MLRPIPRKILQTNVKVKVCTAIDTYQDQTYTEYTVKHVHIQPTTEIRKTPSNTDQQLRSILFADARYSTAFAWDTQLQTAHALGGDVRVVVGSEEYTVLNVDRLKDDTDRLHHYEVSLY